MNVRFDRGNYETLNDNEDSLIIARQECSPDCEINPLPHPTDIVLQHVPKKAQKVVLLSKTSNQLTGGVTEN